MTTIDHLFQGVERKETLGAIAADAVRREGPVTHYGAVSQVSDLAIRVEDRLGALEVGARVEIETVDGLLTAEVVGVGEGEAVCLPFGPVAGVRRGARATFHSAVASIAPSNEWLGRVIDGLGRPVDGKGSISAGVSARALRAAPPPAALRERLGPMVDFGVRALNAFCPARAGQRLGVFSGSGVGKSTLLSMIARNTECDVIVIALIGERGREVREFIEDNLGPEGLARSIIIAATSDEPAMMRREAAFLAMTVSEHFRAQGAHVLCLMDSLTRVAAAQREIGLAAGEPPTTKGYPPSVFSLMPKLLERAGTGVADGGAITGVFTVLVEGDDHDEPIADAARALLDGHIVLDRRIAERGRFPAIDILKTVSRASPEMSEEAVKSALSMAAAYDDMRDLIRIGAYKEGAHAATDRAVRFEPLLEEFLAQQLSEKASYAKAMTMLREIVGSVGED
ncbi:MAG: FliI/YscN family ATPase [Parvularculaceae bacterium]